jgi:hypothetical protein
MEEAPRTNRTRSCRGGRAEATGGAANRRLAAAGRKPAEAERHRGICDAGQPQSSRGTGAADRRGAGPDCVCPDLGRAKPRERPPVATLAASLGYEVGGGEREPDGSAATEEMLGVL